MRKRQAQTVVEYVLIFSVVIIAILSVGFIGKMSSNCTAYLNKAVTAMR